MPSVRLTRRSLRRPVPQWPPESFLPPLSPPDARLASSFHASPWSQAGKPLTFASPAYTFTLSGIGTAVSMSVMQYVHNLVRCFLLRATDESDAAVAPPTRTVVELRQRGLLTRVLSEGDTRPSHSSSSSSNTSDDMGRVMKVEDERRKALFQETQRAKSEKVTSNKLRRQPTELGAHGAFQLARKSTSRVYCCGACGAASPPCPYALALPSHRPASRPSRTFWRTALTHHPAHATSSLTQLPRPKGGSGWHESLGAPPPSPPLHGSPASSKRPTISQAPGSCARKMSSRAPTALSMSRSTTAVKLSVLRARTWSRDAEATT